MTDQVGVFVSYNHKDKIIADSVVQALTSISPQLSVFIDHSGIEGGDEYESVLSKSIQQANWFIIICSGARPKQDMNWCFYEAGQFRAKLENESQPNQRSRMCYLYDGDRPSQFAKYQGTNISAFDRSRRKLNLDAENDETHDCENTELFDLFALIINTSQPEPLRDVRKDSVRQLMRDGVRRITRAFVRNRIDDVVEEIVFQPRISFMLPPPSENGALGLTADTPIVGYEDTLSRIFGIAAGSAKWGDIKRSFNSTNDLDALWICDIDAAAKELAENRLPSQTESLCISHDGGFFRPIVARYERYRSDAKNCYLAFVPARNRQFNFGMRTSLLLSGLILSVRFRQRILPIIADLKALDATGSALRIPLLLKFLSELAAIETEAMEFGLAAPKDDHDEPALLNAFRDGPVKDDLLVRIRNWKRVRSLICDKITAARSPTKDTSPAEAASFLIKSLADLRATNSLFIQRISEELLYVERIESFVESAALNNLDGSRNAGAERRLAQA